MTKRRRILDRMALCLCLMSSCFRVIIFLDQRDVALCLANIVDIRRKAYKTAISRPSVPCILQVLTTFKLYSGRARMNLEVNTKQRIRQAVVKS